MFNYKFSLSVNDPLDYASQTICGKISFISPRDFVLDDFQQTKQSGLVEETCVRATLGEYPLCSGYYRYMKSLQSCIYYQRTSAVGDCQCDDALEKLLKVVVYASLGLNIGVLNNMAAVGMNIGWRSALSTLLPEEIRKNLMAEALYGTHRFSRTKPDESYKYFSSHLFWGLPEVDVLEVYHTQRFHIQPAGMGFDNRQYLAEVLQPGTKVLFEAQPNNPHDHDAVRIWTENGSDLGYVPRGIAPKLAFLLRHGVKFDAVVAAVNREHAGKAYISIRAGETGAR